MNDNNTTYNSTIDENPIDNLLKDIKIALQSYNKTNNDKVRIDVNLVSYCSERKISSIS